MQSMHAKGRNRRQLPAAALVFLCLFSAQALAQSEPIADLQQLLAERSCSIEATGKWDQRSQAAVDNFNSAARLKIVRPIAAAQLDLVRASKARCSPYYGLGPLAAAQRIPVKDLVGWNAADMRASAKANASACTLGTRESWLGPLILQKEIEITGQDMARYSSVTDALLVDLHRLNAETAVTGDPTKLADLVRQLFKNDHFTIFKPYRPIYWEGRREDWLRDYGEKTPDAEPAFMAAQLLVPISMAFALLRDTLSEDERKALQGWGDNLFRAIGKSKDGMRTRADRKGVGDRRANYAASFLAWGATTGNREIFVHGAELFQDLAGTIRKDGTEGEEAYTPGVELSYQNFTYGLLTVAAYVLELNRIPGFSWKRGGSLADGLAYHLAATADPKVRIRMGEKQDKQYDRVRGMGQKSLAFIPLIAGASALADRPDLLGPYLDRAAKAFPPGFFGNFYGGYTSCLFGPA